MGAQIDLNVDDYYVVVKERSTITPSPPFYAGNLEPPIKIALAWEVPGGFVWGRPYVIFDIGAGETIFVLDENGCIRRLEAYQVMLIHKSAIGEFVSLGTCCYDYNLWMEK